MYSFFIKIESVIKYIKNKFIIFYYKLKFGKRLKIGKNIRFRKGFTLYISEDGFVEIGDKCFFNNYCTIDCMGKISIGEHNLFGENVKIYDHNHDFSNVDKNRGTNFVINEINIGNNNWFGSNIVVLKNTKLGNNNVVSAGTVLNDSFDNDIIISNSREYKVKEINYK